MAGDDALSDAGFSAFVASGASSISDPNWDTYPYHRMKNGKTRQFRLVQMGEKSWSGAKPGVCEICRCSQDSEDPLYTGYQREWGYYRKSNPKLTEGTTCFYCVLTHRLRFKAWTRTDLSAEMKNDALHDNFMEVQAAILQMKKDGELSMDLNNLPVPIVTVTSKRVSESWLEAPDENVITEAAFKKRNGGMSFKDAGVTHLVDWHELEDGTQIQGIVEVVGETGVYKRRRRFGTVGEKKTLIDNGQPQIDEAQAEDNFKHMLKKRSGGQKKAATAEELSNIIAQAAAAAKAAAAPSVAACSGLQAGAPEARTDADEDTSAVNDDMGEAAADAALDCMGRMAPRKRPARPSKTKPTVPENPGSGQKSKKRKSINQLAAIEEKATKELGLVLQKFKACSIAGGPFANKVKKLRSTCDAHSRELAEVEEIAANKALSAWTNLLDVCDAISATVSSYNVAQVMCGGSGKILSHVGKAWVAPAVCYLEPSR